MKKKIGNNEGNEIGKDMKNRIGIKILIVEEKNEKDYILERIELKREGEDGREL